ncbi:hypothetical protein [Serratia microhaemolytica]|uniref:hypothetical protein n=1 Tax=Serratia microhaemolytica TaxID=2675110 RepID=UPI000FDF3846|nr:hypothetical protein [Serratia microhaemolytica]
MNENHVISKHATSVLTSVQTNALGTLMARRDRLLTLLLSSALIATMPSYAITTVVVPAGQEGIIGSTPFLPNSTISTTSSLGLPTLAVEVAVTTAAAGVRCAKITDSDVALGWKSKVYGFKLTGPTPGAVLLTEGHASWKKVIQGGAPLVVTPLQGTTTFTMGRWSSVFSPSTLNYTRAESQSDGDSQPTVSDAYKGISCSSIVNATEYSPHSWKSSEPSSSSLNVRFLIDAPKGGLQPGVYTAPQLFHLDYAGAKSTRAELDPIQITVANNSCSLNTPSTVTFSGVNYQETPTSYVVLLRRSSDITVECNAASTEFTPWLYVTASGISTGRSSSSSDLALVGTDGKVSEQMVIRGQWGDNIAPSGEIGCAINTNQVNNIMDFSGRNGYQLIQKTVYDTNKTFKRYMHFTLCKLSANNLTADEYTAQATVFLVQR